MKSAFPSMRCWLGKSSSIFRVRRIWLAISLRNSELKLPDHQPGEASAGRVCTREFSIFEPQAAFRSACTMIYRHIGARTEYRFPRRVRNRWEARGRRRPDSLHGFRRHPGWFPGQRDVTSSHQVWPGMEVDATADGSPPRARRRDWGRPFTSGFGGLHSLFSALPRGPGFEIRDAGDLLLFHSTKPAQKIGPQGRMVIKARVHRFAAGHRGFRHLAFEELLDGPDQQRESGSKLQVRVRGEIVLWTRLD